MLSLNSTEANGLNAVKALAFDGYPTELSEPMRKVVPLAIDYDNNPNVCVPGDPEEHLFASDLYGRVKAVVGEQLAKAFYDIAIQDRPVKQFLRNSAFDQHSAESSTNAGELFENT